MPSFSCRIACYLSDDGGALLTYEAMHETSCFARHWVPFCKKFEIEPRAPEMYFGDVRNPTLFFPLFLTGFGFC